MQLRRKMLLSLSCEHLDRHSTVLKYRTFSADNIVHEHLKEFQVKVQPTFLISQGRHELVGLALKLDQTLTSVFKLFNVRNHRCQQATF